MNTTPDCSFEPIHKDIKRHAASGFVFSGATQVVRVVIQFASVVILARLLNPKDFGLMAMVWPIYNFALMFSNLGFNQAVVQKPDLTAAQINSFFWISSGTGLTICLLLSACSPAVGWFFHDPRAGYLTVAMAVLVLISGIGNLHGAIMMRRMEFRTQAIQNTISTVLTLAVSVIWALVFGGYWSLYAGAAAGVLFSVAAILWHVKWRPSRPAIAAGTWPMLRFGLGVASGNFRGFVAASVSSFAIGHSLGESALGLYDRAAKLVAAPLQQMTGPLNTVVGPILFRLQDD